MSNITRGLRVALPALTLLAAAACSDDRADAPNRLTFDPASTTYDGTGTNGETDVDGAGPGGPRDPSRLIHSSPYAPAANAATPYATDSQDPNMNSHALRGVH